MTKLVFRFKGGKGSGDFGHAGRPGKQGGSAPGKGGGVAAPALNSGKGNPTTVREVSRYVTADSVKAGVPKSLARWHNNARKHADKPNIYTVVVDSKYGKNDPEYFGLDTEKSLNRAGLTATLLAVGDHYDTFYAILEVLT